MAVLALGLAGAAVGGAFGYASIGWMVGTTVGGLLFPDRQRSVREGPRLNDLRVQASSYGVGIPICFGSVRVAGNLIWCGGIREIASESREEVGKGGGQEVTTRTYSYLASFAIGLCAGTVVGIRRVWADGELIYYSNTTDLSQLSGSVLGLGNATFYPGSETQLPDPTIESYLGAGNVPAHRGLAYAVFADADITRWGRIPNLEFEVIVSGTTSLPTEITVSSGSANDQGYLENGLYYTARSTLVASGGTSTTTFTTYTANGVPLATSSVTSSYYFTPAGMGGVYGAIRGNVRGLVADWSPNNRLVRFLTGGSTATVTWSFPSIYYSGGNYGYPRQLVKIGDSCLTTFQAAASDMRIRFYRWDEAIDMPQATHFAEIALAKDMNEWANTYLCTSGGYFWAINTSPTSGNKWIKKYSTDGVEVDSWSISGVGSLTNGGATICGDTAVAWHGLAYAPYCWVVRLYPGGTYAVLAESSSSAFMFDGGWPIPNEALAWRVARATSIVPQISKSAPTLSGIVSTICQLAGLAAADLTVTALTDSVTGFAITRPMTARAAIEALQKAYWFDAVESDDKLKFVKRGGSSAVTIPGSDLGAGRAGDKPPDLLKVERSDEVEAPRQVVVQYWNNDGSYAQATEYARRLVVRSVEQVIEELPLVLTPAQAAQAAEVMLYAAHVARTRLEWSTSVKYARYEPTDVVTLNPGTGITYVARIVRKREDGQRIVWEAELDNSGAYTSSAAGGTSQQDDLAIGTVGPTLWEALDIPVLRDQDDDYGYYVALAGIYQGWRGAALFDSADDANYAQLGGISTSGVIGRATSALGNFSGGNVFDELSTVTVQMLGGTPTNASESQVLAGANHAVLGSEIIAFKTATLVSGTTYRLSGLLRGRFGTEQYMGTHASGETFALLSPSSCLRPARPSSELGATRYLKAASYGESLSAVTSKAFVNSGVGKKPLAPVYLRGSRNASSDLIVTWVRRTRIGGEWRDYVDASLGEASESYEIDIRNAGDTATLRTLTSSSPTVTYTASQQTTDFGAPQSSINVRVYQMSAAVGRGFAASGAL